MFSLYDNGGKTVDRYTIYFWNHWSGSDEWEPDYCITTNGKPEDFWQHSDFDAETVGLDEKQISVFDLPNKARRKLLAEMERQV